MTTERIDIKAIKWDPLRGYLGPEGAVVPYRSPIHYEVREGGPDTPWALARRVRCSLCPEIEHADYCVGDVTYQVRAVKNGRYSAFPSTLTRTIDHPAPNTDKTTREETTYDGGWPATKANVAVGGTSLYLTGASGTYTTEEIDLGELAAWRISICPHVRWTNHADTWEDRPFWNVPDSTWENALGQPDDGDYYEDTWIGDEHDDWTGDPHAPTASVRVEFSVHETPGGAEYVDHRPGYFYGRYLQIRVTLSRGTSDQDYAVTGATNATPIVVTTSTNHGLETGDTVAIHGVGGNTAANGHAWFITRLTDTTFSLDHSAGNGAYTAGGVVVRGELVALDKLTIAYSKQSPGSGPRAPTWLNVRDYGATGDGVTDDTAAINAALQAAKPNGNVVYVPPGTYLISDTLNVPNRTWLMGATQYPSQILADASFPAATEMIRLGEGGGIVFNCRAMRLKILCADVAEVGVFSDEANEQSGVFDCDVDDYTDTGIAFTSGASIVGVEHVKCFASVLGSNAGILFSSVAGHSFLRDATVVKNSGVATHLEAVKILNCEVSVEDVHVEHYIDGIVWGSGATGVGTNIYGGPGNTNTVRVLSGAGTVTLIAISKGASSVTLEDDIRGLTRTDGTIPFWSSAEVAIGNIRIQQNVANHTSNVIATLPDFAGSNRTFLMIGVGILDLAQVPNPLTGKDTSTALRLGGGTGSQGIKIRGGASSEAAEPYLESDAQTGAANRARIPDLGSGSVTRDFVMTAVQGEQEVRSLRVVDVEIKSEGQSSPFVTLDSADQTGAGAVTIPDLGDALGHFMALTDVAQVFTNKDYSAANLLGDFTLEESGGDVLTIDVDSITDGFTIGFPPMSADDQFVLRAAAAILENKTLLFPIIGTTWVHQGGSLGTLTHSHAVPAATNRNVVWNYASGDRRVQFERQARTETGTTDLDAENDDDLIADSSSNNITVNLPAGANRRRGRSYRILKVSTSNTVTIDPDGTEQIQGASTRDLGSAAVHGIEIVWTGSFWFIVSEY